jgi:transcriptional regulator with XRE-family HTH domain
MNPALTLTLADYLARPGVKQQQLAAASGLPPSLISRLANGKAPCSVLSALKLDAASGGLLAAEALCDPALAPLIARLRAAP